MSLHEAAEHGRKPVVEWLLDHGAEVNAKDKNGDTPLHFAAFFGHRDVAELLLANQAEINAKDSNGVTPLHFGWINAMKTWPNCYGSTAATNNRWLAKLKVCPRAANFQ